MIIESAVQKPMLAVRQRYAAQVSSGNRPHIIGVGLLSTVVAAFYSVYALVLYSTYRDSSYDLVIFDQAIRSYSRFHLGVSVIKGLHNGFSPTFSVLGDHFSPLDAVLAPLYWIYNGPQTLLIAQPVLFALAIPWLWKFTRRAFGGTGWMATTAAYLACLAYALSWPIAAAVAFDYHEVALAPLLIAIALERLQAGRLRPALIALGLLLLVKEDMGLLVAGVGATLLVSFPSMVPRQRLVGLILIVVGVTYSLLAVDVFIPAFGGKASYYWAYSNEGSNIPQVILHYLQNPRQFFRLMFYPSEKFQTLNWLFAVFCFLPLISPFTLAALPLLIERMEADGRYHSWWGMVGQYNAFLVVILVLAAVDGAARLDRWITRFWRYMETGQVRPAVAPAASGPADDMPAATLAAVAEATPAVPANETPATHPAPAELAHPASQRPKRTRSGVGYGIAALACLVGVFAATLYTVPRFALGAALHGSFYTQTAQTRAAAAADATVPSGVVVAAANDLGPELSARDTVLMWDGDGYTPPFAAPWVVADVKRHQMTFGSPADQQAEVRMLQAHGYKVVFHRDGYLVLHRPGPPRLGVTSKPMNFGPPAPK